jgi:hypothetical protein
MEYLIIIAFAWWFVEFEPIQFVIDAIFEYIPINFLSNWVYSGLGCFKCMGFWSGLIYSGSFGFACITSLLTYIVSLCLSKMN